MTMLFLGQHASLLDGIAALAEAPLTCIAERLREAAAPYVACSALLIFTEDCTGRPHKKAGAEAISSRVSIAELESLRVTLADESGWIGEAEIGGQQRRVLAMAYPPSRALLVLTDPGPAADLASSEAVGMVTYLWRLAARRIQEKVADAPPSYLLESRAASAERVRVTSELVDQYSTVLVTLLAVLRSAALDDRAARTSVTEIAARALIELRTLNDRTTDLVEEPVTKAFERLREDLRPLTRFSGIDVQFIEPPQNGRALPGEVAHAARAIVRGLVLAMMDQPDVHRIRTQWGCDGENLLVNVRDDGRGALAVKAPGIARLERQVQALTGKMRFDVIPDWGADVSVTLPLNPPEQASGNFAEWKLSAKEIEILEHLAAGERNRTIAHQLNISENTVKFHIRNLLRKMDVGSRTEAVALAHSHGLR